MSNPEPYTGVEALFNGDLHSKSPGWAPREDWKVLDASEIVYLPPPQDLAVVAPKMTKGNINSSS